MCEVIPFLGHRKPEFTVVVARISLNSRTRYMVRVQRGSEPITEDLFRNTYPQALAVAMKDIETMTTIHKKPILLDDRVGNNQQEVKP